MEKIRVASLFSGIGGFEAGLDDSNIEYELVFSSEIDENAKKSYIANYPEANLYGDITKINENDIPDHDLLCAGFPCQSFSIAGKRLGFDDTRGTLFFDVYRILKHKKPKFVLLENVKNLVNHDQGNTIRVIISKLQKIGYTLDIDVLNSAITGLPQSRERTYIVGIHNHPSEKFELTSNNLKINKLKSELNNSRFRGFNFFSSLQSQKNILYVENILEDSLPDRKYLINNPKIEKFLEKEEWIEPTDNQNKIIKLFDLPKDIWNDLERQRRVYSVKGISPTVLARSDSTKILLKDKRNDKYFIRKFTPKENFRVQGFNETFIRNILNSGVSETQLYKQSGNAVSPPVISLIVNELFSTTENNKYKFIDLFCGLGGFRIAAESENMSCVFSSDIDAKVREVYKDNFGDYPFGDITEMQYDNIPDHDLLCAGFPCQPFSLAGKRLGFDDTRGTLFFEVASIIKIKKPKFVLLENVAGLVNHDSGKTIQVIEKSIDNLGYAFFQKIMNAKDYGVPQNRLRWYGVAIRKDIYETMNRDNLNFHFPEERELAYTLHDVIDYDSNDDYKVTSICKNNIEKHIHKFKNSKRYRSDNPLIATEIRPSRCNFRCDGISPCLTAKMGTGGNNVPVIVELGRKYTEKECLRIMGFPEWYKIPKNKMQSYKQLGNSVVVPVIQMIIKEINLLLEKIENAQ